MSRRPEEKPIIDSFTRFLARTSRKTWHPSDDEVTLTNGRSYDCEFASEGATPIAADFFRLFALGSDQKRVMQTAEVALKLSSALKKVGVDGVMFDAPSPQPKHLKPKWYQRTAGQIAERLAAEPTTEDFRIDGMRVTRIGGEGIFSSSHKFSAFQPPEAAGSVLARIIADKNDQLDVPGHSRYLVGVNSGTPVDVKDLIAACAFIDFSGCDNIDRIYFQVGDDFELVYDKRSRQGLEAGRLPCDSDGRLLAVTWIEEMMAAHWPEGLDLALRVSWDEGNTDWLSASGRVLMETEALLLLQNCEWSAPKMMWELFRGPRPLIGDGRRVIRPIVATSSARN
jgi:hypothetical protein